MSDNKNTGFSITGLSVDYDATQVVRNVSMSIDEPGTLVIVGPSGCGKSTIIKAVAGLVRPSDGSIVSAGRDITKLPPQRRRVGYVPQNYALFAHLTALGNVAYGLRNMPMSSSERREKAMGLLEFVQLQDLADHKPAELSGGQRQRVALARALAIEPDVLLLDEPLSALDPQLRTSMRQQLHDMLHSMGIVCILVTHDRTEALSLGDKIAVMHKGTVAQVDTPDTIWRHPADPFVANFLCDSTMVPVHVEDGRVCIELGDGLLWPISDPQLFSPTSRIGVHAALLYNDTLQISTSDEGAEATVIRSEYMGNTMLLTVRLANRTLTMTVPSDAATGRTIRVTPKHRSLHLI